MARAHRKVRQQRHGWRPKVVPKLVQIGLPVVKWVIGRPLTNRVGVLICVMASCHPRILRGPVMLMSGPAAPEVRQCRR